MKFEDMINTIQLGDCYEMIKNIPDKSIDLVYIDIPYLIGQGGKEEKKSKLAQRIKNQVYGELNKIINGYKVKMCFTSIHNISIITYYRNQLP